MVKPKVLVLLAAHNGAKWIVQQVETILTQASVDLNLIISDDGSSDETREKIAQFAHDGRVRIVAPPIPTGSAAQNFLWLIRNTCADAHSFVAFADQDDLWHKEKLVRACSALNDSRAVGYSCSVTAFWKDGRRKSLTQRAALTGSDFMFEGAGQGCTFVLQKHFFLRIQEFLRLNAHQTQALHYHDWAIYALSRSWKVTWYFDAQPMVQYRQHEENDTGARASPSGVAKRFRLIKSGWYRRQLGVIAQICALAAPEDKQIAGWNELIASRPNFSRQFRIARICIAGGRRRKLDNFILVAAVLRAWV